MTLFITQAAILRDDSQPLTHARIGYENLARGATITASSAATGYPSTAARNPDTYTAWQPTALPATWLVDTGGAATVDYVGLASHDLGSVGATVYVEYSEDNISWTEFASVVPGSDRPVMILGDAVTARYWRLRFTGTDVPTIGVIYIGQALAMYRPIYGGHTPITLSRETEKVPSMSEGGQFLGNSIIRKGVATSASWQHLPSTWVRDSFDPFVKAARSYPFFFAWRPADWSDEIAYVWCDDDIAPSNMGIRDLMQVGFSMNGIGDYE